MTTLIVRKIDPEAPGSYRERRRHREITKRLNVARKGDDVAEIIGAMEDAEDYLIGRLSTDDGTSVEAALDLISAKDFDNLLHNAGGEAAVPPANASDSPSPSVDTSSTSPIG